MSVEKLRQAAESNLSKDNAAISPALIEVGVLVLQQMLSKCAQRQSATRAQQVRFLLDQPVALQKSFRRKYRAELKRQGRYLSTGELTGIVSGLYKSASGLSIGDGRAVVAELLKGL